MLAISQNELSDQFRLIEIERLNPKDARKLIDNYLHPHALPEKLIERIIQFGNGNPYFIAELNSNSG